MLYLQRLPDGLIGAQEMPLGEDFESLKPFGLEQTPHNSSAKPL
jgi:hypothetical protein